MLPQSSPRSHAGLARGSNAKLLEPQAIHGQIPGWGDVTSVGVRLQEGESHHSLLGLSGTSHTPAAPSQEPLWESPWRTEVWTLQLLHACRNLCLRSTACNMLSICPRAGQTAVLQEIFLSLCAPCCALVKTNCSSPGPGGLCSSSCDGMAWVRRHLLCIHTHDPDGHPFRSARGFISSLGSYAAL